MVGGQEGPRDGQADSRKPVPRTIGGQLAATLHLQRGPKIRNVLVWLGET